LNSNRFTEFKAPLHRIKRELDLSYYQISQRQAAEPTRKTLHISQANTRSQLARPRPSKQAFKHNAALRPPGKNMFKGTTESSTKIRPHPAPLNKPSKRHPVSLKHSVTTKPLLKQKSQTLSMSKPAGSKALPKSANRLTTKAPSHFVTKPTSKLSGQPKAVVAPKKVSLNKTVFKTRPIVKPKSAPKPLYQVPLKKPKIAAPYKPEPFFKSTPSFKPVTPYKPAAFYKKIASYKPAVFPYYKPSPRVKYRPRPSILFSRKPTGPLFVQTIAPMVKPLTSPKFPLASEKKVASETILRPQRVPRLLKTRKLAPTLLFSTPFPIQQVPLESYSKDTFTTYGKKVYTPPILMPVPMQEIPPSLYFPTTFRPPLQQLLQTLPPSAPVVLQSLASIARTLKPRLTILNLSSTSSVPTISSFYAKATTSPILETTPRVESTTAFPLIINPKTLIYVISSDKYLSSLTPASTSLSAPVLSPIVSFTTAPYMAASYPSASYLTVETTTVPSTTVPYTTVTTRAVPSTTVTTTTVPSTTVTTRAVPSTTVTTTTVPSSTVATAVTPTTFSHVSVKTTTTTSQAPTTLNLQQYVSKKKVTLDKTKPFDVWPQKYIKTASVTSQELYPRPLCPPNIMYNYPYPCFVPLILRQLMYTTEKPTLTTPNYETSSEFKILEKPTYLTSHTKFSIATTTTTQAPCETTKQVEKCKTYKSQATTETINTTSVIDQYTSNQCNTTCKPDITSKLVIGVYFN